MKNTQSAATPAPVAHTLYAPGTTFLTRGHTPRLCTVTDRLVTTNLAGESTIRYVATHQFLGQIVTDNDVTKTTIQRGLAHAVLATDSLVTAPETARQRDELLEFALAIANAPARVARNEDEDGQPIPEVVREMARAAIASATGGNQS